MEDALTIIIPVFNEEDNLHQLSDVLGSYMSKSSIASNVLFVNDGSTDNSQQLIESICQDNSKFKYITLSENSGLSAALKVGFDNVNTKLVGYMDADLQTDPNDFDLLLEHIDDHAMVSGIRTRREDSFGKRLSSIIANSIRRLFTNDGMDDTGCPLKILKTSYAQKIPMFKGLHRFLPAMIMLQKGTIKQIPVRHYPRFAGTSKFGFWNRLIGPLTDCFAYIWMKRRYIRYHITKTNL